MLALAQDVDMIRSDLGLLGWILCKRDSTERSWLLEATDDLLAHDF